ncbi:MAG: hypothetical protein WD845_07440 [Pirellulales bacterium]
MAGYVICSLDAKTFEQLTTAPTMEQCMALAENVLDGLDEVLGEYSDELAADHAKWPLDRVALAKSIERRLASPDWYADLTYGDAVIWCNQVLGSLQGEVGEQFGIDFRNDNDGILYWDAAAMAAEQGATMMAEPQFGGSGFRNSRRSWSELELNYAFYPPADVQKLLAQLEGVRPHFEAPCDEDEDEEWSDEQEQFFEGLLEPVRKIAEEGRVMWVQTDT